VHSQAAGSSSLLGAYPRPTGPRGIYHGQSEPVFAPPLGIPRTQPYQQQRPQVQYWQPQQRFGQRWPCTTPQQQVRPPALQTVAAVRNIRQSNVSAGAQSSSTNTVMKGSHGGWSGQHVAARPPTYTLGPRSADKTREFRTQLLDVFPDNAEQVDFVLRHNQLIYSVDELCLRVAKIV